MEILNSIFKLAAGIGLFLFGIYLLEESLKNLSGRNFKLFLQRSTKSKMGAVAGGTIVTAILQSSSMVSLMVLAFVGAGIFSMKNALAIILGANLGTTLDSWLVATLGFKTNIEIVAYPAVCIGGFLLILFSNDKKIKYLSYFLLGFGLLFISLSFMKTAMEVHFKNFDFSEYAHMPMIAFLFIGFMITLIVQSSLVTIALTLSAIHTGVIDFQTAVLIALGAETGTTIKTMLAALGGNASKKQVALGNLMFNVFLTILAFIFLKPILFFITDILDIKDPLIGLVTFSSLINLVSILIFLPFMDSFSKFVEQYFKDSKTSFSAFIGNANIEEPETALDLFRRETYFFIHNTMLFNLELFNIFSLKDMEQNDFKKLNTKRNFYSKTIEEKYEFLKQLQGELQKFYLKLVTKLQNEQISNLNQLISSARSAMHSAKSIKDIDNNINNLKNSSKDIKYNFFIHHKKETEVLYLQLDALLTCREKVDFEKLEVIFNNIQNNYTSALNDFYSEAHQASIEDLDITMVINFNRELFTSNKAILMAIKDILLDEKQAENFNEISVYKT